MPGSLSAERPREIARERGGKGSVVKAQVNIQDTFLNQLRKDNIPVTVYLINGFQLRGSSARSTTSPS